jgi:hypothetical protein
MAEASALPPAFNIVKPSTTGIPGEELRLMTFDPAGNLWVAGRWPFWEESGVAMLSADQLQANPLPGGGFDTGAWKVWSSVQNPIPSPYLCDMEFSADGTMWLASEGGLTRFRPNAPSPADRWFTYTPANSPLIVSSVLSIAIDSNGNIWVCNADVNQSRGLFKLNPQTNQWTHVIIQAIGGSPQLPSSVTLGNNNHILVSMVSSGGFAEFDGSSWTMRSMAQPLDGLLQDAQGNVWAISSASGNGLWKWNGSSWQNWPTVGGTITMTGLGKDRDGVVYVSTWYGGVYKMINDTPAFFVDADNIPRSVIGRPNGDIWINNYGGNGTPGTARQYTAGGQLLRRINTYNSGLPDYFNDHIKRVRANPPPKGGLKVVLRIPPEGWEVPPDSFFQNNFFLLPGLVEAVRQFRKEVGHGNAINIHVTLIPHLGSATIETRTAMGVLAARNTVAVLRGQAPLTPVT